MLTLRSATGGSESFGATTSSTGGTTTFVEFRSKPSDEGRTVVLPLEEISVT